MTRHAKPNLSRTLKEMTDCDVVEMGPGGGHRPKPEAAYERVSTVR